MQMRLWNTDGQDFHPTLPLPVRIRQIERTGAGEKRVLQPSPGNTTMPGSHVSEAGSIPIWWVRTPYGGALEIDGTGVVNASYRYSGFK